MTTTGIIIVSTLLALLLYLYIIRPWQLRWGADDKEVNAFMAGDELVDNPTFNATRAITINAPPEYIWPWIVQMGSKRAGWYSYDWIDNLGKPSADHIIPELQRMELGQNIMVPEGKFGIFLTGYKKYNWILWADKKGKASWVWGFYPLNDRQTRLVTRIRLKYNWFSSLIIVYLLIDVGDIIMLRKCLLEIKKRAEKLFLNAGETKDTGF